MKIGRDFKLGNIVVCSKNLKKTYDVHTRAGVRSTENFLTTTEIEKKRRADRENVLFSVTASHRWIERIPQTVCVCRCFFFKTYTQPNYKNDVKDAKLCMFSNFFLTNAIFDRC